MNKILISLILVASLLLGQMPVRQVDGSNEPVQLGPAGTKYRALMQAVPNSTTTLTATTTKVQLILCNNQTGSTATLTITDGDASPRTYYPAVSIAANTTSLLHAGVGFTMTSGIKWSASASSTIYCQIEGAQ